MEYIQTILFQIAASRLEEAAQAGGLLSDLDEHRKHLNSVDGFRELRLTRSVNSEGNVLIVLDTRWTDDTSLVRYETGDNNAAAIVRKHESLLVPNTLQVMDMEALRTESSYRAGEKEGEARNRVVLPIVIPLGILAFALLVIYGLSRVYLEIGGDGAVVLAAGLAIAVLIVSFFLAMNPKAPGWLIGGILGLAAIALIGGTIWAVAEEDEGSGEAVAEEGGGDTGGGDTGGGDTGGGDTGGGDTGGGDTGGSEVIMGDNFFEFGGEQEPTITVPAGEETVLNLTNSGAAIHNMHVASAGGEFTGNPCDTDGTDPCSDPNIVKGKETATITINLEAGEYPFRCDFHADTMKGTLVVE
jgi:plastocyanin/heme-degrading monooxygenase HmoA